LADQPGWAYHNRANAISALLPDFEHHVILNPMACYTDALLSMAATDLIICPDPRLLPFFPFSDKTILHVNAIKIFM
jgi:hypothetical protein